MMGRRRSKRRIGREGREATKKIKSLRTTSDARKQLTSHLFESSSRPSRLRYNRRLSLDPFQKIITKITWVSKPFDCCLGA